MNRRYLALALLAAILGSAAAGWWWWQRPPDRYFGLKEVDRAAYPNRRIDLEPPKGREGVDYYGTLRMDVFIDHRGNVERVEMLESTVPPSFREKAVKAFTGVDFEPALKAGRKVKSLKRVEIRFLPPIRDLDASQPSDR